jgi:sterol desaturase/sphingolipid hydroxylase (fatty acid hydroxylase superfamily)
MQTASETGLIATWVDRLGLDTLVRATGVAGLAFVIVSLLVLLLEMWAGGRWDIARYKSKCFMNDVLYSAFYRGGLYGVFVWAAVANVFEGPLGFLRLNLLNDLPLYASVPLYWIAGDFALYWLHRAQHAVPFLWAFHSVHHAERELSTLSQNRRHPVERLLNGLTLYLPFAFILGLPTRAWIPWWITAQMLEALQHAQLDWRFGPLYRVVVSPVFHSIHHSAEPRPHNRNYSAMFSIWDYLFGTAAATATRPRVYGVEGLAMAESLPAQLFTPFRMLASKRSARAQDGTPGGPPAQDRGAIDANSAA